jgi:hypothetical protein
MSIILLLQQALHPSCCKLVLVAVIFVEARHDENKRQERDKKRKEKTTPFGANLMRSQVLCRAAQVRHDGTANAAILMHVIQSAQSLWNVMQHCQAHCLSMLGAGHCGQQEAANARHCGLVCSQCSG